LALQFGELTLNRKKLAMKNSHIVLALHTKRLNLQRPYLPSMHIDCGRLKASEPKVLLFA
jgi:hypothetical protein